MKDLIFGHKSIIIELVNANRKNAKATHHVYIVIHPNAKTSLEVRAYVVRNTMKGIFFVKNLTQLVKVTKCWTICFCIAFFWNWS